MARKGGEGMPTDSTTDAAVAAFPAAAGAAETVVAAADPVRQPQVRPRRASIRQVRRLRRKWRRR